ncbi:MAG: M28 family peptidase, partial [Acidobacteriota bacterium]
AQLDVLQWDSLPYDAAAKSFGFKASRRAADRIRRRLETGPVQVRVEIDSTFYDRPDRTLVAEIRGRSRPEERIVLVAHVQEPGTNDNASGCGTLLAIAAALRRAIADGALPPPERTLTFLWLDESRGSDAWLAAHPGAAVQYMFALDMTGEDTARTGGTFLIEKQADPSAVWDRPSDPHTEWSQGSADVAASSGIILKGSLLNDLYLAMCRRRGRDVRWEVRTNPYEGGSDHTVFARAGVPSLLAWHFTDRYYHTNQDRLDKISAAEMANVAIATGAAAWFLAGASRRDADAAADLVGRAGIDRLALERRQGRDVPDQAVEQQVREAWLKWYGEALDSVLRLPPAGADAALRARVELAKTRLR